MTCNIIDFKSATTRNHVSSARTERAEPSTETLSPTLKNSRLRKKRKAAWRAADAVKDYWRARLNLNNAVERVQRSNAPEGRDHPAVTRTTTGLFSRVSAKPSSSSFSLPPPLSPTLAGKRRRWPEANIAMSIVLISDPRCSEANIPKPSSSGD
jgi:hypothetical protein